MNGPRLAMFGVLLAVGVAAIFLAFQLVRTPPTSSVLPAATGEHTASAPAEVAPLESSTAPPAESNTDRQAFAGDGECRMFGLVVDELEQPIAGENVKLSANDGALVREARTGSDGRYELRAPLPGPGSCEISFTSERLFTAASRRFWHKKPNLSLRIGDNDLGRTMLEHACAIEGRVTLNGAPVPYAELCAVQGPNFGRGTARSAADGSYRLGPLALGEYRITVADDRGAGDVELARVAISWSEARHVDLVVPWGSLIAGHVVDANGAPSPNAAVRSQPATGNSKRVARVIAAVDGSFCVPLESATPNRLLASEANWRAGFDQAPGTLFAAGETSVVLAVTELPRARFQVVEAQTRVPIERFGLRLSRAADGSDRGALSSSLEAEIHARGECVEVVESGDCIVQVSAPGYESRELRLDERATHDDPQVIEMHHGATLLGHVTLEGKSTSLGSARLKVAARDVSGRGGDDDDAPAIIDRDAPSPFLTHWLTANFDFDGSFRFEDLAPGTYELSLRGKSGSRAFRPALQVERGQVLDVGEIAFAPGARLRGRAVLPPRANPVDVRVMASAGGHSRSVRLDALAQFEFDDLVAGDCTLSVSGVEGALVDGPPFPLQLAPSDEREIVLDLRDREGMWLTARVSTDGRPIAGARIRYSERSATNGSTTENLSSSEYTQEDGIARMWLARSERVTLDVSSNGLPLGRFTTDVTLASDGDAYVALDVEVAVLVVDWRALSIPGNVNRVACVLDTTDEPPLGASHCVITEPQSLNDRRSELGLITLHASAVRLFLTSADGTTLVFRRSIACRTGETCECVFSDTDRVENAVEQLRALGY